MPFRIIRDDISRVAADAIVCSASPVPAVGGGGEAAIHAAAGPGLLRARERFGTLQPGAAVATKAYGLHARYVIHTVGPVWRDGNSGEVETLHRCYRNAICTAISMGCKSAAFPLISSGAYGFSKTEALRAALWEFQCFAEEDIDLILVVYDREAYALTARHSGEVAAYIDDNYIAAHPSRNRGETVFFDEDETSALHAYPPEDTYCDNVSSRVFGESSSGASQFPEPCATPEAPDEPDKPDEPEGEGLVDRLRRALKGPRAPQAPEAQFDRLDSASYSFRAMPDLETRMRALDAGFSETLLRLIDASGCTDAEIYKRANISRKLFSKIRSAPDYRPSKPTALAFCVALHMTPDEARELLARAGYTISHSSRMDVIVEYFLETGNYDILEINETLFCYDQPLLGSA